MLVEKNSIIYHSIYGFGIVKTNDNGVLTIDFIKTKNKKILQSHPTIKLVDSDFVDKIISVDKNHYFDSWTISKSKYYGDVIEKISYHNSIVEADIYGTSIYHTSMKFNGSSFTFRCNCPVNGKCKHEAALYSKTKDIISSLLEKAESVSKYQIDDSILDCIDTVCNSYYLYSKEDIKILNFITGNLSLDCVETVFNRMESHYRYGRGYLRSSLIDILVLNDDIRKIIIDNENVFRKYSFAGKISNLLRCFIDDNSIRNSNRTITSLYLYANGRYKEYLCYCFDSNVSDQNIYINDALTKVEIDDELFECITDSNLYRYNKSEYYSINDRLSFEQILILLKTDRIYLTYNDIKKFDAEQRLQSLPYIHIQERECNEILKDEITQDLPDKQKAMIVDKIYQSNSFIRSKLINIAKKLPDNKYFIEYLNNNYHDYLYDYYGNGVILKYDNQESFNIIDDEFFTYFKADYAVTRQDRDIYIDYYLYSPSEEMIMHVSCENNKYRICSSSFASNHNELYGKYLVNYIHRTSKEELQSQYKTFYDEIFKEIDIERTNNAIEHIKALENQNIIIYSSNNKAKLEYHLDFDDQEYLMSFKVGVNKMYVVKDAVKFLDYFEHSYTETYGKNFIFTHTLDNFDDPDRSILKLLTMSNYIDNRTKYISLKNGAMDEILNLLQNNNIHIGNNSYEVRLDRKKMHFSINDEYRICTDEDNLKNNFFTTNSNVYVVNEDSKKIDCLDIDKKDVKAYVFLLKNIGTNIKPLLKEFKNNIYYDHNDIISINDEIADDFKIENVRIDAYFDYDDKIISLRSEYYLDDKRIDENELKENYNVIKKNRYLNCINSFGFVDDKLEDDAKILNFFYADFSELKNLCNVYLSLSLQNKKLSGFAPGTIRVQYENNIMQAFLKDSSYSDEELSDLLKAIKKKKKFVFLSDNRIIDISGNDAEEFLDTVESLKLNKNNLTQSVSISTPVALKAIANQNNVELDDYLLNMINEIANFKDSKISIPNINGQLRLYQKQGFKWLSILSKYHVGGILADDMGLGKTIEIITLIVSDKTKKPNLIICPKSVVFNWINEFNRFAPDEKVVEIYGSKLDRKKTIECIKPKEKATYIVSYDSLRNDIEEYKNSFNYLVLDEAQFIKNLMALKTKSVKLIKAEHKLALTGTPIENNIIDLYSIFDFIMPGYFDSVEKFRQKYENDENKQLELAKAIAPFVLRRTKKDVLNDLPDKYEHIITAQMSKSQLKVYDAYVKQARDLIESGSGAFDILPYLTRLRQICIDPSVFIENYEGDSGKIDTLMQIVEEYLSNDHRILIFSQFVKALNIVEDKLKKLNIPYFMITGNTDAKQRIDICNSFNNNSKEKIVLVSLKAGGTGLNLIGADTVIHLDPWWNVASENQATDRSYRIGQNKNVEVIKLICEDSIEQRVIELQNIKKDLIDKLISDDDSSVVNASLEDIKFILKN